MLSRTFAPACGMLAALFAAGTVLAETPDLLGESPEYLLVEARQLVPEEPAFEVRLYVSNPGSEPVHFELPASLSAELVDETRIDPVVLVRVADDGSLAESPATAEAVELAPGRFVQQRYRGMLPVQAHGVVSLRVTAPPAGTILFSVKAAELNRVGPFSWGDGPDGGDDDLLGRILSGLKTYEPIYFIAGGDLDPVTAKFQLSAQYRILLAPGEPSQPKGFWGKAWHHAHDVYVGYTQTSVWELDSPSAPFRDSSFRPAVYYLGEDLFSDAALPWDRFGLQLGFEHESNGERGSDSRSMNIAFVRPIFTFDLGARNHFTIAPKIYAYLEKDENKDIDHYRGYVDLLLKVGRVDGLEVTATLRKGTKKAYGSAQVDATFPVGLVTRYFGAFFHAQFFYGYGETLLNYDKNAKTQLRGGILIVPYGALYP